MNERLVTSCLLTLCLFGNSAVAQRPSSWPIIKEFGGAIPKNESSWIGPGDYPTGALRNDQQGNVIVAFEIGSDGKATNCTIEVSSGVSQLDNVPCKLIERKARFKPALDKDGTPAATKARYSVAFWIPE